MTQFHDVRFPIKIAFASEGGPMRRTQIVTLASGHEQRNSPWAGSRRRFNAGFGIKSLDEIAEIIAFFEARQGQLHGFRWRDPFDWKSSKISLSPSSQDQIIGTGDGQQTTFQLTKTYASGSASYQRLISKPVSGSVSIAIDGVDLLPSDFTVDTATGEITVTVAPALDAVISAGFLFDIPVRFDTDQLSISLASFEAGDIPNIPVIEVLS